LLTRDPELQQRARILRLHGMDPKYHHQVIGGNFRLDALQAALLAVKLPHFAGYTAARQRNAALYTEQLSALPGARIGGGGEDGAWLILPATRPENGHIWNQYTLRLPGAGQREALRTHLTARGIGSEIYYPIPLHEQACFAYLGYEPEAFPVAHRLAQEVISLPIYPELGEEAIAQVCRVVAEFGERLKSER
jgi:dTDP-4-amino-4,6-dideoxygalactose transaminase